MATFSCFLKPLGSWKGSILQRYMTTHFTKVVVHSVFSQAGQFFLLKLFHLPSELWHTFLLDVSPLFLFLPLNALTLPPCNAQKLIYVKRRLLKVSCLDIMHNASIQSRYQHLLGTLGRAHRAHLLILRWRIWYHAYCRDRGKIEQEVTKSW